MKCIEAFRLHKHYFSWAFFLGSNMYDPVGGDEASSSLVIHMLGLCVPYISSLSCVCMSLLGAEASDRESRAIAGAPPRAASILPCHVPVLCVPVPQLLGICIEGLNNRRCVGSIQHSQIDVHANRQDLPLYLWATSQPSSLSVWLPLLLVCLDYAWGAGLWWTRLMVYGWYITYT